MYASVAGFRLLVAAQLVLSPTTPAAQPARHVHRLENGVQEHVVIRAPVLPVRPLLVIQVLLPPRLRGFGMFPRAIGPGTHAEDWVRARRTVWDPSGRDVVVEVEDVVGVVAALDFSEPVVVGAVGGADGVEALIVA